MYYKPDIWFMATEPLLYPHFFEAAATQKRGMSFHHYQRHPVSGIPRENCREQLDRCLFQSQLRTELHDKITGIPGAFSKVMAGLEPYKSEKVLVRNLSILKSGSSNHNYRTLYNHVKTLALLDIDKLTVAIPIVLRDGLKT